ncbi:MAG: precorrin-2 C(20)-methyltransferase [Alphaproteobacteria bacterium]|nr:precorrin-2 C(20)-methyltransferase [Rhodospirillaceae bacterium]MBT6204300.1 precorrin-2 C(20)-methyltransferase [Rhodospirillaceae bacterium]MBT6511773.1 precorrin-2 C(20)-methyltransferase [Rhodospirillaceae bacterium]MBT7615245.1 precorrin-2 C(20)-methyltransferase [Rhodospirillaceae bacterium]MDG2482391.1 precorrin-2 C(20)-methyltransferase [Alphaproteobacteria bacterium]
MTRGTLFGLGVGPGDPELITLKAHRLLTTVPVVAYPAPEHGDSLARSIVASFLSPEQTEIAIRMPLDLNRFPVEAVYDQAAIDIAEHLDAGRDVAAICEGDPFFYGSFMYLFGRLSEQHQVEVVPGVSSLLACPAAAGAPLAARDDVLMICPGLVDEDEMLQRLANVDAAAIIKVGRHLGKVRRVLEALDLVDRAHYVEHATMADQVVLPFAEIDAAKVPYFSMILIHRRGEAWR